jgi:hypothetical protein
VRAWIKNAFDEGSTVASYRLVEDPGPLEAPIARGTGDIPLPVGGRWLLASGTGPSRLSFYLLDNAFAARQAGNVRDYVLGQPLFAPFDARTTHAAVDPPEGDGLQPVGVVRLRRSDGFELELRNLDPASLPREEIDVSRGATIARVGFPERPIWPKLEVQARPNGDGAPSPLLLSSVIVRLNPSDTDPWSRHLDRWTAQPGFLVEQR